LGDEIKTNEMHGTCGKCGREERFIQHFGEKRPLERLRRRWVDNITRIEWGRDWADLIQDGDKCRGLVNTVINTRVW
jgi:hypothetical protein